MTRVIAFSLWGNDPKYCVGAIRNAELALEVYPDWECWFYTRNNTDASTFYDLAQMDHVRMINVNQAGDWTGMFDRFLPALDPDVDVFISRDCDSRLTTREKAAVDEWLESDNSFHIMRDHPWHGSQILGGMFGMKHGCLPEFGSLLNAWNAEDRWQTDQDFLNTDIYPRVVQNAMIHASFFRLEPHSRDFPMPRNGTEFVGQVFDENEVTVSEHVSILSSFLR